MEGLLFRGFLLQLGCTKHRYLNDSFISTKNDFAEMHPKCRFESKSNAKINPKH